VKSDRTVISRWTPDGHRSIDGILVSTFISFHVEENKEEKMSTLQHVRKRIRTDKMWKVGLSNPCSEHCGSDEKDGNK
jgi:hypothetical protein